MREVETFQGHRAVRAQRVGVEEYALWSSQFVHRVDDALVLQTCALRHIPLALTFKGSATRVVVGQLGQSLQYLLTEGDTAEEIIRYLVFSLHPCCCLCRGVVLQPTIGVSDLRAEILVYCAIFRGLGVLQLLCHNC